MDEITRIHPADESADLQEEPSLVVLGAPAASSIGRVFRLTSMENVIGRDPVAEIWIPHETISRRHATVRRDRATYVVKDLASTNGTFVNRNKIRTARLHEGDILQIGNLTTLRFTCDGGLADSERQLRQALAATRTGAWEWTPTDGRLNWSESATRLFGIRGSGNGFESVHPDDRDALRASLEACAREGRSREIDVRLHESPSGIRRVVLRGEAYRDESGFVERVIGTMTDADEQREVRHRMILADRMTALGTLAAGIGHEVNTPLAVVITNLGFLEAELGTTPAGSRPPDPEEIKEVLAESRRSADQIRSIVQSLRTFSRDDESLASVDLVPTLETAARMTRGQIRPHADLACWFDAVPPVRANEARLVQVVVNLLLNAAQAIEGGTRGEVRLSCQPTPDGRVAIEVADTGCGIPAGIAERVFESFFTTKPEGAGTGLGLSICHSIVTSFGGEIGFEPRDGGGTIFRVVLPVAA